MKGSKQEWVGGNRPPRVQIKYDVEIGNAIEMKELPFVVGIMANLSGKEKTPVPADLKKRKFVSIDADNFDDILEKVAPTVTVEYDADPEQAAKSSGGEDESGDQGEESSEDTGKGGKGKVAPKAKKAAPEKPKVTLIFKKMDDFNPGKFLSQVEPLDSLYKGRCLLRDLQTKLDTNEDLHGKLNEVLADSARMKKISDAFKPGLDPREVTETAEITDIIDGGKMAGTDEEDRRKYSKELIAQFVLDITAPQGGDDDDVQSLISDRIAEMENALQIQLNSILHQPNFQELEATWRGLSYLVNHTNTSSKLKLRVLNVSKDELRKDIEKAVGPKFDQSALFKKVYEEEYGTFGGEPYSLLIGDYSFGRNTLDIEVLEGISGVAAAAHAPFLAATDHAMFDLQSFADLSKPRDLTKIFESIEMAKWRDFRDHTDSRYVTLTLPRVLIRNLYGTDNPVDEFDFVESVDGKDPAKYLWANPAYVLGQRITNAFYLYGWTAAIRGVEGGGLVENLPMHTFKTDDGDIALKCPTEIAITDRREKELTDLGFVAICHCKGTDKAAFFGSNSANSPHIYNTNEANANSRISAMLPYLLAASRFAHYIKVIMRDKVGSFMTRQNAEDYLNTWIVNYVLLDDDAHQETKARYPLREARIDVTDVPGKPGAYKAVVFLKPHFQLEELTTSIRLVAELPPPAG